MQALVLLPEWQCDTCTAVQKINRGCTEPAAQPVVLDDEPQERCPRRILLDKPGYMREIWWLYQRYSDGIFPEQGGLYDQPAKYLAVMRLLEEARAVADSEKEDREKRKDALRAHVSNLG